MPQNTGLETIENTEPTVLERGHHVNFHLSCKLNMAKVGPKEATPTSSVSLGIFGIRKNFSHHGKFENGQCDESRAGPSGCQRVNIRD